MIPDPAEFVGPDRGPGDGSAGEPPQASGLHRLGKIFGTVVAPTSLVTALLYYFGWSHAAWYFEHFGVESSVLGLGTVDYLFRSVDAIFVPVTLSALAGLLALWARAVIRWRIRQGSSRRIVRAVICVLAGVGILLTLGGIVSVFRPTVLTEHLLLAPLSLTLGPPLIAYANGLRRPRGARRSAGTTTAVTEWAIVFTLVAIGLFWAAGEYSAAVGTSQARRFAQNLPALPAAVVYSERALSLNVPGVTETRCHNKEAAFQYRYDGLVLMLRATDQYLLVPREWTEAGAVAVLLPRTEAVRLEFVPANARAAAPGPSC
ncbi:hypothetical protein [Spirillospora sp. NPDC029432]|uniref:hypothetical protein n=1 Tax=Spirillospora sp. NPDC029432 TaxID=3154599 RepID=UPI0034516D64